MKRDRLIRKTKFAIGVLIICKINFVLGQYRLRKDINAPEHVIIRL